MKLPRGYVFSREDRHGMLMEEWYAILLKVPNSFGDWREVAEVEKEYVNVCTMKPRYAARLLNVPDAVWMTGDNLEKLCIHMCVLDRMRERSEGGRR